MSTVETFVRQIELPVTADEAFRWHEREGAFERLVPPWENVQVLGRTAGLQDGARRQLVMRLGPLRLRWIAEHYGYEAGRQFCDRQIRGPFASWEHTHSFAADGPGRSTLTDEVRYAVPGGRLGQLLGGRFVCGRLARMFDYRQATTAADLAAHARHAGKDRLHVAVTGASGLVGSSIVPLMSTGGHRVTRIVRRSPAAPDEVHWDSLAERLDSSQPRDLDAVVHLAGENIAAARWSSEVKERIRQSRVQGTRRLCEALAGRPRPPKVLISASAIGYYGDRGDAVLDETSAGGTGFLADVAREWEAATQPAREAGIRVVLLRLGVVLSPRGGALARVLPPFKVGGGGRIGSGRQWWSWISIDDAAGAIHHALMTEGLMGPVNAVAPHPVTNAEFTATLGRVLRRPAIVPLPAFAARLALGEMADALLLASLRVVPRCLETSGYVFRQPTLEVALRHLLGR